MLGVWSQLYYFSGWSRCAVRRARLSPCFLTESLCYQCEPDSATFPAESVSCVWSESAQWHLPATVVYSYQCNCTYICSRAERLSSWLSHRGALCSSVLCKYCGGVRGAVEEESGVPAAGASGEGVYSDIVQRSASEQTHMSLCIWYSTQM